MQPTWLGRLAARLRPERALRLDALATIADVLGPDVDARWWSRRDTPRALVIVLVQRREISKALAGRLNAAWRDARPSDGRLDFVLAEAHAGATTRPIMDVTVPLVQGRNNREGT